jgi:hypothetical protein
MFTFSDLARWQHTGLYLNEEHLLVYTVLKFLVPLASDQLDVAEITTYHHILILAVMLKHKRRLVPPSRGRLLDGKLSLRLHPDDPPFGIIIAAVALQIIKPAAQVQAERRFTCMVHACPWIYDLL